MKAFICILVTTFFITFSNKTYAQSGNSISIKGMVMRMDTNKGDNRVIAKDSLMVLFRSYKGIEYYILPDEDNHSVYNKIIKHPNTDILITGSVFEKKGQKYIYASSFMFL